MVFRGFTNTDIKWAVTARQSLHQKYEQYKREHRRLIPLTDLYCLCWWAAGWEGRGHIWSLGVIALPRLRLPIQLKLEGGLGDDSQVRVWQWSDVFSGRPTKGSAFSNNSTLMAGSQKIIISLIIIIVTIVILSRHRITCLTAVMRCQSVSQWL